MESVKQHMEKEITGKQLNEMLGSFSNLFLKITNYHEDDVIDFGMPLKTGLNEMVGSFKSAGICDICLGITFDHVSEVLLMWRFGKYARQISVPDDARVYVEYGCLKADKLIMGEKKEYSVVLNELIKKSMIMDPVRTYEFLEKAVKHSPYNLRLIDQEFRTYEMMKNAVKNEGCVLENINEKFRTEEIVMEAIKSNGTSIRFVGKNKITRQMVTKALETHDVILSDSLERQYLKTPNGQFVTFV